MFELVKKGETISSAMKSTSKETEAEAAKKSGTGPSQVNDYIISVNHASVRDKKDVKKFVAKKGELSVKKYVPKADREEGGEMFQTVKQLTEVYFIFASHKFSRLNYPGTYDSKKKQKPDCRSNNGITPLQHVYASTCAACPNSQWTKDGAKNVPPACRKTHELLAVDISDFVNKADSPEPRLSLIKLNSNKSNDAAVNGMLEQLSQDILFDDGSVGKMNKFAVIVKLSAEPVINSDGSEAAYCNPVFEFAGTMTDADFVEKMTEKLTKKEAGKSLIDKFLDLPEADAVIVAPAASEPGAGAGDVYDADFVEY